MKINLWELYMFWGKYGIFMNFFFSLSNENMKNKIKTINQQTNRFNILILHIIGIEDEKLLKPLDLKLFFIR